MEFFRNRKKYRAWKLKWFQLLYDFQTFTVTLNDSPITISYSYNTTPDENLQRLKEMYSLDKIAGNGTEIEQIVNLMTWVYKLASHANEPEFPKERNAFRFIKLATVENKQLNCYMKTVILNEVYLAMGFYSRTTHLLPHSDEEKESHFITSVFSTSLNKWISMDPDFGMYVIDKNGVPLGVKEIRKGLIEGKKMKRKGVDKKNIKSILSSFKYSLLGVDYFWFLSEFLFKMRCPSNSKFNQEMEKNRTFYELIPDGYLDEIVHTTKIDKRGKKLLFVRNEEDFWQKPE
ncbi:MAG: hypothetical protein ACFFDS_04885 [Candidatus Thorarchaeota archaeon]